MGGVVISLHCLSSLCINYSHPCSIPASGLLGQLDEEDDILKSHALYQLSLIVDDFWAEIAEEISTIEALAEAEDFAAKVFFYPFPAI
jgi:hypothetical protein